MKILHVITGLNTGGAERMLVKLIDSTYGLKVEHSVISLLDKGSQGEILEKMGISVRCLNMKQGIPSFNKLMRLGNLIVDANPDVIQSWMYHANVAAYVANLNKNYPLIFNIRHSLNDYENEKWSTKAAINLNSLFSSKVSYIIFNSEASKKQHEKFGFKFKASAIIPNGFNTEKFKPDYRHRLEVRNQYNIDENVTLIGAIGRNHSVKGFDIFLESCSLVSQQTNNVKFILIGKGIKQDEGLKNLSFSLGIREYVIFENERDDIEKVWPALDIYCNSSHSEAFSNTIGEAMLNEIPCVVTDVGDSSKIVGSTGKIVPVNDPQKIADSVIELIKLDNEKFTELGEMARNLIIKKYSIKNVSNKYLKLYNKVL